MEQRLDRVRARRDPRDRLERIPEHAVVDAGLLSRLEPVDIDPEHELCPRTVVDLKARLGVGRRRHHDEQAPVERLFGHGRPERHGEAHLRSACWSVLFGRGSERRDEHGRGNQSRACHAAKYNHAVRQGYLSGL